MPAAIRFASLQEKPTTLADEPVEYRGRNDST